MSGVPLFDDLYSFSGSALLLPKSEECEKTVEPGFDYAAEAEEEQEDDPSNDPYNNSGNCPGAQPTAIM